MSAAFSNAEKNRAVDVLIVGSGLAGLLLSIELVQAGACIAIATKMALRDSNTSKAQGGLAAALSSPLDSAEQHLSDTLRAGAGLVNESSARTIIGGGAGLVSRLTELSVLFDRGSSGQLELALEGGHSQARVLHSKDATGKAISDALIDELNRLAGAEDSRLTILENASVIELLAKDNVCSGARLLSEDGFFTVAARSVVLCTGGVGQLFARTTNPSVATGDGIALAFRSGAVLCDLEFVQFHPTALSLMGAPAFLISEAVRGAGALLLDESGNRFARRFHPDGELATRDIVARAIHTVMLERNCSHVFLDLQMIENLELKFPNIVSTCRQFAIDPLKQPIPISPAAHYFMGGIVTDLDGATTVKGLYAIGECASTGLHGANRLASNSLLEAGVMSMRCAKHIETELSKSSGSPSLRRLTSAFQKRLNGVAPHIVPDNIEQMRHNMYTHAGVVRNESGLNKLIESLAASGKALSCDQVSKGAIQSANMLTLCQLIAAAALYRKESRGAHFRSDYAASDDFQFRKHLQVSLSGWSWETSARTAGQGLGSERILAEI